jgi:thioredoxin-like negative regulator of GroEL
LTEAEANGRLALYAARRGRPMGVVAGFATPALRADPRNEDAEMAMQRAQIKAGDYAAALHTLDALCTETAPQRVVAQCAAGFAALAAAVYVKKASLDADGPALEARALRMFEKAVASNAEDLASWYRLAEFVSERRDIAYAKALLPQITPVQAARPRVASLAASVASLCAATGDLQGAVKYAGIWEQYSLDGAERASAAAYIAQLKGDAPLGHP